MAKLVWLLILGLSQTVFSSEPRKPRWPLVKPSRGIASSSPVRFQVYRNYVSSLTDSELREFLEDAKIGLGSQGIKPGKIIVKFADEFSEKETLQEIRSSQKNVQVHSFKGTSVRAIEIPSEKNIADTVADVAALKELTGVLEVYPNIRMKLAKTPNDPRYGAQYYLNNNRQQGGFFDADVDAPEAWEKVTGSEEVVVGVIDTGINYTHPDIAQNIWSNPGETGLDSEGRNKSTNGIDDDDNGFIDDFRGWNFIDNDNNPIDHNGHGTHVAGIIGAVGNNGVGIAGVNWSVKLVPIQVFDALGYTDLVTIMWGINYATIMGFPITNNSYGGYDTVSAFEDVLKANLNAGSLFVAAAGNDGLSTEVSPFFPASYDLENIISVAASDQSDRLAEFSNFGKTSVDLSAPGVNILSLWLGERYLSNSGTSMASPVVAGAAALLKALHPEWTFSQIRDQLFSTVDVFENSFWINKVATNGRLNIARAVGSNPSPLPLRLELHAIEPSVGPVEGGVRITLTGIDFSENVQILIGSKTCGSVNLVNRSEVTCLLPPGRPVLHNVKAINPDGVEKTLINAFRYFPEPQVISVTPPRGSRTSRTLITVKGKNFSPETFLKLGEVVCEEPQIISSEEIRCRVPEQAFGVYPVRAQNEWQQVSRQSVNYQYLPQPEIESITPEGGPLGGGNWIVFNGKDFIPGARVFIAGKDCLPRRVISQNQMRCRVPRGPKRGRVGAFIRNLRGLRSPAATYIYR